MVFVGQSKAETIMEEKGYINKNGISKYKVLSNKLSNKRVPHNHHWIVQPIN